MIKKCLVVIIFVLPLLYTFGSGDSETATNPPVELEITKALYFGTPTDNAELKQEFAEYLLDEYNLKLKLNDFPRPEYMTKFALAMSSGDIKGFGWIFGGSYMEDYYHDGASVSLTSYVEKNSNWNSLPEGMRKDNLRNNELLALPSGWREGLGLTRTIRADWLENLGLDLPTTIEEFYDMCVAFNTQDPDGNGKHDTIAMTSAGVWNMQDIFMSFGVPTNHVSDHCITPDPNDGYRFNDGMLKPGMKAALEWLQKVYEEGLLDVETFSNDGTNMRDRMTSGKYGSTYYWANWTTWETFQSRTRVTVPDARYDMILGLTSEYAKTGVNLGGMQASYVPYILIAGTKNPQEQVDQFINIFLIDEIGHWAGTFGIPGKTWVLGENNEIIRSIKEVVEGKNSYYPLPGIVGEIRPLYSKLDYPIVWDGESAAETEKRAARSSIEAEYVREGLESGILYRHPNLWKEPQSASYREINADIARIFAETVAKAVTGLIPVDEAIDSYRTEVGRLGGQQVLDEANAAIGKTSSAVFRY